VSHIAELAASAGVTIASTESLPAEMRGGCVAEHLFAAYLLFETLWG
jgi:hypothetical protein